MIGSYTPYMTDNRHSLRPLTVNRQDYTNRHVFVTHEKRKTKMFTKFSSERHLTSPNAKSSMNAALLTCPNAHVMYYHTGERSGASCRYSSSEDDKPDSRGYRLQSCQTTGAPFLLPLLFTKTPSAYEFTRGGNWKCNSPGMKPVVVPVGRWLWVLMLLLVIRTRPGHSHPQLGLQWEPIRDVHSPTPRGPR